MLLASAAIKNFTHPTFSNYIFWTGLFSILAKALVEGVHIINVHLQMYLVVSFFVKQLLFKSNNYTGTGIELLYHSII